MILLLAAQLLAAPPATASTFPSAFPTAPARPFGLADVAHLRTVDEPRLSPSGDHVLYTVDTVDLAEDEHTTDLWLTAWKGDEHTRLTFTSRSEHHPAFSPDDQSISFLGEQSDDDDAVDQLWRMRRAGGEAERLTSFAGGVLDYAWSPDGRRLVLVVEDPDPDKPADSADKKPKPIVIDRYFFKEDETGYLGDRRQHLVLFELATRKATPLTSGPHDEHTPVFSPDGARIAFVSKRGPDPDRSNNFDIWTIPATGGPALQVTTFAGADNDPEWDSPLAYTPDGRAIVYLQGGTLAQSYYPNHDLAVVPATGGPPRLLTPGLDRSAQRPAVSADGKWVHFLIEDDGALELARVKLKGGPVERLTTRPANVAAFALGPRRKLAALASTPARPYEVHALERGELRPLSQQNDALLAVRTTAPVETIRLRSQDGTDIHGFLIRPHNHTAGRVPTILDIHGGPVAQFDHAFNYWWQVLAANGYAVVAVNPRGSSGRGNTFARAIFADWGGKDADDVLAAVDHAVALGVADPERLGVGGWSYGGILTNYVIEKTPRFKAAVSGASIANMLAGYGTDMYVRDYEAELGPPWKTRDLWIRLSSPFLHADRITTPTLFLCGERDYNVPLLASEQMYQALRSRGVATRLVVYPDEPHTFQRPSFEHDRDERWLAWYRAHLKGGKPPARR